MKTKANLHQPRGPTPGAALLFIALAVVFGILLYHSEHRNSTQDAHARVTAQFGKEVACAQAEQTIGASRVRQVGAEGQKETVAHWRGRLIRQRHTLIIAAENGTCPRVAGLPPFRVQARGALAGIDKLLRETGGIPTAAHPHTHLTVTPAESPASPAERRPAFSGSTAAPTSSASTHSVPESPASPESKPKAGHRSVRPPASTGTGHSQGPSGPASTESGASSPSPAPAANPPTQIPAPSIPAAAAPVEPAPPAPANPPATPASPVSPSVPPLVGVEVLPELPIRVCVPGVIGINC